jgi:hypothetical protein
MPTVSGPERNWMIASDVIMLMRLMLDKSGTEQKTHAPGPFGLVGGYPLIFKDGCMRLDEAHFTSDEMERVNQGSLECDGISEINANGIIFTDEVIAKMKEIFNLNYPKKIALHDCERFSVYIADSLMRYCK